MKKTEVTTKTNVLSDLFDKSSTTKNVNKKNVAEEIDNKTTEKPKIDLFSDNLFDDIDDIFTTNVVKIPKKNERNHKSLFDDEDDLFAGIATGSNKENVKSNDKVNKSIFESDDDLFTDKAQIDLIRSTKAKANIDAKPHIDEETKEIGSIASESKKIDRSIFDSDDELFSDKLVISNTSKVVVNQILSTEKEEEIVANISNEISNTANTNKSIFDSDDELFNNALSTNRNSKQSISKSTLTIKDTKKNILTSSSSKINKSIFDSDDELFPSKTGALKVNVSKETAVNSSLTENETRTDGLDVNKKMDNTEILNKTKSIFDSDSDSDIFSNNKATTKVNTELQKTLTGTIQTLESNHPSNSQTLVINTSDKLNNLRSPSLFDEDDEELFITKDKIKNPVISNEISTSKIINELPKTDIVQSLEENTKIVNNFENSDSQNTNLDVKIENDYKEKTQLCNEVNLDKSPIPTETAKNENSPILSEATITPSVSNDVVPDISKTNVFDSDSNNAYNSIYNVNEIDYRTDFEKDLNGQKVNEKPQLSEVHDVPAETDIGNRKENDSFIDRAQNTFVNENLKSKQNSNIFEQNENLTIDVQPNNLFEDIFIKPPEFNKIKDLQSTEIKKKTVVFSDMFSEPPVFEKPKEPKKSKNVNALFDDDSDDEALFFRKSDVVDDVPNDFSQSHKKDNLFGIFHDEPPAMDVDFTTKSKDAVFNLIEEDENIFKISKDPVSDDLSVDKLDSKQGDKIENIKSVLDIPEEVNTSKDSEGIKSKTIPITTINIHDLFSKNDDIFKSDVLNSEAAQKKAEYLDESPKSLVENRPDDDGLHKILDNKQGLTTSIFDDQNDDLFKQSNLPTKKKNVIQEDEIDNLFITKNKDFNVGTSKSFDHIFKTTEHDMLIKETKIISHNDYDNNSSKVLEDEKKMEKTMIPSIKDSNITIQKNEINSSSENISKLEDVDIKNNVDNIKTKTDTETAQPNKIGKLKAKINIDVSKLLPGASPKKKNDKPKSPDNENSSPTSFIPTPFVRNHISESKVEETKQEIKPVSNETIKNTLIAPNMNENKLENSEQKNTKSITFDEQSSILDNTLSKERAKIQVKRRPSTRRARREAVRKSTIDNDSTDNSSSIDDQPKSLDIDLPSSNDQQEPLSDKTHKDNEILHTEEQTAPLKDDNIIINKEIQNNAESKLTTNNEFVHEESEKSNKSITSKIVYVLNDEDIFNTKLDTKLEKNKTEAKITENINPVSTLDNAYKDKINSTTNISGNQNTKPKVPLFNESSDEDKLFGKNRKTFKTKVLFDSDSDDDLFVGSKDKKETKDDFRKRAPIVKGSLFGDDDDDALFGDKRKKSGEY